jgi:hypothetical protein
MFQRISILFVVTICAAFCQHLPLEWSQAYGTYDVAHVHDPGEYSFGFAINNYALYGAAEDSVAYDTRRFDLFAKVGVFKNTEFEIKFASPTSGVIAGKYNFWSGFLDAAFKFGIGYMKGTRSNYVTDYVFDVYPTMILSTVVYKTIGVFYAPKLIYSIHTRDRQEHSDRAPRQIFQYGHCLGIYTTGDFSFMCEGNWLSGNNEGVKYVVNQFGLGIYIKIK